MIKTYRLYPGCYVTLDGHAVIRRADSEDTEGGGVGWQLIVDEQWWNTFPTKREALEALTAQREASS